jgi:ribosomal protein S12 methylthiotransferase
VPDEVKAARKDALMEMQQGISLAKSQAQVGKVLNVLVEGHGEAEDEDGPQSAKLFPFVSQAQ